MSDDFTPINIQAETSKEEDTPQVVDKLISSQEVAEPEIQTWTWGDLPQTVEHERQAREEAIYAEIEEKLQPQIQQQAEVLKQEVFSQAQKEGFDAGYEEGKKLGQQEGKDIALAQAQESLAEQKQEFQKLLESMQAPYRLLENHVFEELTSLALHIAEEVIQKEVSGQPEWLQHIIDQALEVLGDDLSPVDIKLNPQDLALLESLEQGFPEHWNLKASDKVSAGTCQVQQRDSSIEHNWKNRFESMSVKLQAQAVSDQDSSSEP